MRLGSTNSFSAIVIGPRDVPAVTEQSYARAFPSLAILSAFSRGHGEDALAVAQAAVAALETMPSDRVSVYFDLILGALDTAASKALEEWMDFKNYVYTSDFAKRHFAEGEAKGKAEGEASGKAEGKLAEARVLLLEVLGARALAVADEARKRIDTCSDLATLRRWVVRAAVVESVAAMFD